MQLTMDTVSSDQATTGMMNADDNFDSFYTLELPWRDNDPNLSCVPAGTYDLIPYNSPKHGATWCLRNPALKIMGCDVLTTAQIAAGFRSFCELHAANFVRQLLGCLALGTNDQPMLDPLTPGCNVAIEGSRNAVARLCAILGPMTAGHTLTINRSFV
jgi:hypothetical protein